MTDVLTGNTDTTSDLSCYPRAVMRAIDRPDAESLCALLCYLEFARYLSAVGWCYR